MLTAGAHRAALPPLLALLGLAGLAAGGCAGSTHPTPPPQVLVAEPKLEATVPEPEALREAPGGKPGELDRSFGQGGVARISLGKGEQEVAAMVLDQEGRATLTGYGPFGEETDLAVFRVRADGQLDTSFGTRGITRVGSRHAFGHDLAAFPDGRLLVAGYHYPGGAAAEDLLLARLSADGALDRSFGKDGVATFDFTHSDDRPTAVFALPDGGALVVGDHSRGRTAPRGSSADDYEIYVARFDAAGALDPRFGDHGVVYYNPIAGREFATRAVRTANGHIVLGGYVANGPHAAFVARLLPDGSPDPAFGSNGGATVVDMPPFFGAWALAVDGQGRVLLGGQLESHPLAVARFTPAGALDASWGKAGIAIADPSGDDQLYRLGILPGGGVVGVGFRGLAGDANILVARFGPNGALDAALGGKGLSILSKPRGAFAMCMARDARGRLLVASYDLQGIFLHRMWM